MIKRLFNFKVVAVVAMIAMTVGISIGGSIVYKWAKAQEVGRLTAALEMRDREKDAALAAQKVYYENLPPVEVIKTEVEYVIKKIPYPTECDVTPDERRMLDYTRTGVRAAAPGPDQGPGISGATGTPERISRAAEVLGHVDAATRYRQCYAVAKAIETYTKQRVKD